MAAATMGVNGVSDEWTDLEAPATKPSSARADPVRFRMKWSRHLDPAERFLMACLIVRADVLAQLGWTAWKNLRVRVRQGKGARSHQVALFHDEAGPIELHANVSPRAKDRNEAPKSYSAWFKPVAGHYPNCPVDPPMERPYKVEANGKAKMLVVDLPAFCFDAGARRAYEAAWAADNSRATL